ncbi:MAG: type II secretion system F family protein [Gammaproteobacteria bacterium]|nr:type II secretion system F family protein [Gammaproteobacteria bacterium]
MPNFRYRARASRGDLVEGQLEAASIDAAATQLINTGVTPIDIVASAAAGTGVGLDLGRYTAAPPELTDLVLFARQIYTMLRAGIPINQAMIGIARSTRNAVLAAAIRDVQVDIESGRELSTALARHPRVFSTLFVSMVRVGENTGRLDEAFLQMAAYLELERDTRQRVKSALRYPVFVVIAMAVAIGVINVMVIPAFAQVFERAHVALPLPTRVILATSGFFVQWWPVMIITVVAAVVAARYYAATDDGRYNWDKWKLSLPIAGDIIYRATLGRFARAFSMALSAGVPLIQALTVVSRAVDNEYVGARILNMRNGIERGETLTRTAAATGMFTPIVLQMLSVGEETGAIDSLMTEVASFYEREVDYDVKNLSQTIEPILIVCIGGLVLVLALGVFLPMWDLASVKLGR